MRVAVIGHVEWCEFVRVERVPLAGEIIEGSSFLEEPSGGGAVAAVQMARLAGSCDFFTAFGDGCRRSSRPRRTEPSGAAPSSNRFDLRRVFAVETPG